MSFFSLRTFSIASCQISLEFTVPICVPSSLIVLLDQLIRGNPVFPLLQLIFTH